MAVTDIDPDAKSKLVIPQGLTELVDEIAATNAASADYFNTSYGKGPLTEISDATGSSAEKDKWVGTAIEVDPMGVINRNFPISKAVNICDDVLMAMSVTVEILKVVSQVINVFQSDIDNLFKVLNIVIEQLIKVIEKMLVSFASTGVYVLPLLPDLSPFDPAYKPGGGFEAAMAKINHALTNPSDPNRPMFSEGDYMGAIICLVTAGSNYGDLLRDLGLLMKFLGMEGENGGYASGPLALSAAPGLYSEGDIKSLLGVKKLGIQLSWGVNGFPGTEGFVIRRSTLPLGEFQYTDDSKKTQDLSKVMVYTDLDGKGDSGNSPTVEIDEDNPEPTYSYIDFDVEDGKTYYYQVTPYLRHDRDMWVNDPAKAPYPNMVDGEVASIAGYASATATGCIPDSVLTSTYETPTGLRVGLATGDKPYWTTLTLRGLLGEAFDSLLQAINDLADRIKGVTVSSTALFEKQIKMLERWIKKLTELLDRIKAVIEALNNLKFSAATMMLTIAPERGGMESLKARIGKATFSDSPVGGSMQVTLKEYMETNNSLCNVYGGFMILVGAPSIGSSLDKLTKTATSGAREIATAASFREGRQAAHKGSAEISTSIATSDILSTVVQAPVNAVEKVKAKRASSDGGISAADTTIAFLTGLLGGR